jgi:hypothetical protein
MTRLRAWLERLSIDDPGGGFWTAGRAAAFNAAQLVAWTALALWRLPPSGHFQADEALFYDASFRVARSLIPAAYGPPISQTSPVAYTPGGGLFDLYAPPFLFTRNPLWGTAWVVLLTAAGLGLFDRTLRRLGASGRMRVIACALATWGIWHARFADRMWNAHAFLFAAPLLWWLSVRLRDAERGAAAWAVGWGVAAALLLQIHASGILAVVVGVLWAWPALRRGGLIGLAAAGAAIAYLPWLIAEAGHGFADAALLVAARPRGALLGVGAGRSLAVFLKFASQSARVPEQLTPLTSPGIAGFATFCLAGIGLALGLRVRGPWRRACVWTLVLVPAFLAASGREYFDHYVIAPYPLYVLPSAAALSALAGRARALAWAASGYLALFVALGVALLWREYVPGADGSSLPVQQEVARTLVARGTRISGVAGADRKVVEILARDEFDVPLQMSPDGAPCVVSGAPLGRTGTAEWQVGSQWWLSCAEK